MKRRLICILLMIAAVFILAPGVSAEGTDELLARSGAENLYAGDAAESFFAEHDISFSQPEGIMGLTPGVLFRALWQSLTDSIGAPLRLLILLLTVSVLSALVSGTGDTVRDRSLSDLLGLISVLVCVASITGSVGACFRLAADTLETGGTFMLAYVPVFATITAAGGGVVTAASYQMILLSAAELAVQIASELLLPLLQMALAVAVVDSINPSVHLTGLLTVLKKTATWALGLMVAVFGGLLSVQGMFGASADSAGAKATKFMISSCVPVVGNAVSDAYNTVRGSVGVLRGGIGAVGLAAVALTVLPPILLLFAYRLSFFLAGTAAELLDAKPIHRLCRNVETILSVAVGTVVWFSVLFLIATALMILLLGGG